MSDASTSANTSGKAIIDIPIDDNMLDKFREAGKISAKISDESKKLIMIGGSVNDVVETIEAMIIDEGADLAFPVNISINDVAAHYTSGVGEDDIIFSENDVVKVDLGCFVDGGIGDIAYTIDLSGKYKDLLDASKEALNKVISSAKSGIRVSELGGIIEDTITSRGFKPIKNLGGHKILPGILHAGVSIPNVRDTKEDYVLKEGDIFACEPFATTGKGYVVDAEDVRIFSLYDVVDDVMRESKKILRVISEERGFLPFSERWVYQKFGNRLLVKAALKQLVLKHALIGYPVLKEVNSGIVSQFEHTLLVKDNGVEVLTRS